MTCRLHLIYKLKFKVQDKTKSVKQNPCRMICLNVQKITFRVFKVQWTYIYKIFSKDPIT